MDWGAAFLGWFRFFKQGKITRIDYKEVLMNCRPDCGACCTAPSISSPIPSMPFGKPADTRCVQLSENNRCQIFGSPLRPSVCSGLQPSAEMCGTQREHAMTYLLYLEAVTAP